MFKIFFGQLLIATALSLCVLPGFSQTVKEPADTNRDWSKPYQPFRIVGNIYYVGTYDLACYLVVTKKGHMLINTGLASSGKQIKANVEQLGFSFKDIKILLTTQAHFDHMGAMAEIKRLTGAQMMVDEKDATVMADGGKSDYALGSEESSYAPVKADRLLKDGDLITLGDTQLKMLHHPGHTKGSCSFVVNVAERKILYKVLIANMPTIVTQHKFSEVKAYPEIAADYAYTLKQMKALKFHIWLSSHASQFDLHGKHKEGQAYNPDAFRDQQGYDAALADLSQAVAEHEK